MKLIYKGKFDGNPESLPQREHLPAAVKFKEPETPKKMAIVGTVISAVITVAALAPVFLTCDGFESHIAGIYAGLILPLLCILPHELLHALCFKDEVYLYTNMKQGNCFVVGTEVMSKARFIILSLLPNIVFGFIPYIVWLVCPGLVFFGIFGAVSLGCGAGDYMNVYNALTQMPKGAKTYMSGFHSYWYIPE